MYIQLKFIIMGFWGIFEGGGGVGGEGMRFILGFF